MLQRLQDVTIQPDRDLFALFFGLFGNDRCYCLLLTDQLVVHDFVLTVNRIRIRDRAGGAGAGATHERDSASEEGIVADRRHRYRGRSRTCPGPVATADPPHGEAGATDLWSPFQGETGRPAGQSVVETGVTVHFCLPSPRAGQLEGTRRRVDASEIVVIEGQNVSQKTAIARHLDLQVGSNGEFPFLFPTPEESFVKRTAKLIPGVA